MSRSFGVEADQALEMLETGDVFFLAGSGISLASNLPSASQVLEHTARAFLPPRLSDEQRGEICEAVQPEAFYESVINIAGTLECLELWRSLGKRDQDTHGLECRPSSVHLFIAAYSKRHGIPILTTNFDSMFEEACRVLGVEYELFLPADSPPPDCSGSVAICKLHGSVDDENGEFAADSLATTMTQITRANSPWLEFLGTTMQQKHACIVGYSGRDIDLFPYVREYAVTGGGRGVVWINRFDKDPYSDEASTSCGALKVSMWPDELLPEAAETAAKGRGVAVGSGSHGLPEVEALLSALGTRLAARGLLSTEEKELLYAEIVTKLGRYRRAHSLATQLDERALPKLERLRSKHRLLLLCSRLCHEVSRYESCGRYAIRVLKSERAARKGDYDSAIQAMCWVCEARLMDIPNDPFFRQWRTFSDQLRAANIALLFFLTIFVADYYMYRLRRQSSGARVETQHDLIEHRIRLLGIVQGALGSPERGWRPSVRKWLLRRWDRIRDMSYEAGYAAGIANAGKYRGRLAREDQFKEEAANIYRLTTSATGRELLVRDEADRLVAEGDFDESRRLYAECADMARASGNALNELKAIIGFAYSNLAQGHEPLLTDDFARRWVAGVPNVENKHLRRHFTRVDAVIGREKSN